MEKLRIEINDFGDEKELVFTKSDDAILSISGKLRSVTCNGNLLETIEVNLGIYPNIIRILPEELRIEVKLQYYRETKELSIQLDKTSWAEDINIYWGSVNYNIPNKIITIII